MSFRKLLCNSEKEGPAGLESKKEEGDGSSAVKLTNGHSFAATGGDVDKNDDNDIIPCGCSSKKEEEKQESLDPESEEEMVARPPPRCLPPFSDWFDDDFLDKIPLETRLAVVPALKNSTPRSTTKSTQSSKNGEIQQTKIDAQQMLLAALVEYMCSAFDPAPDHQTKLYSMISRALIKNSLIPPFVFAEEMHSLRDDYRLALGNLFHTALEIVRKPLPQGVDNSPNKRFPEETRKMFTPSSLRFAGQKFQSEIGEIWLSRYKREFVELSTVGKGGFGQVYKVRCKLDDCQYAIKKISFQVANTSLCFKTIREVQLLAKLNHPNVVRYFGAWFEYDDLDELKALKSLEKTEIFSPHIGAHIEELSQESNTNAHKESWSHNLRRIVSEPKISFGKTSSDYTKPSSGGSEVEFNAEISARKNQSDSEGRNEGKFWAHTSSSENLSASDIQRNAMVPLGTAPNTRMKLAGMHPFFSMVVTKALHLYVQMELCSLTLRDYMRQRNLVVRGRDKLYKEDPFLCVEPKLNRNLMKQVLEAVAYIHEQGVIHRDIKPGNLFLRLPHYQVLLGDFGLACISSAVVVGESGDSNESEVAVKTEAHTSGVGTLTYSAPEQLNSTNYGPKVDMFSVGVVMYELYYPFRTYTEKIHGVMDVRRGMVSEDFQQKWPVEAGIIRQLVQANPSLRPHAKQLIESSFFMTVDEKKMQAMQSQLSSKDDEIRSQKEEIKRLKELLNQK